MTERYCPCAGDCHHSPHPCSVACLMKDNRKEGAAEHQQMIEAWGIALRERNEARETACRLEEELARLFRHIEGLQR